MMGLLHKDQMTIWSSYRKNFLLVVVLYTAMAYTLDMAFMLFALVFMGGLYIASTLSFDEMSHWDAYARTLPVSPGQLVGAKYLLALGWMAGSFVLAEILLTVSDLFKGELQENLMYNLAGCLVSLGLVLIYYALTLPLSYKLGAAKARSGVIVAIGISLGLVAFTSYATQSDSSSLASPVIAMDETSLLFFSGGLIAAGLVLFVISWWISTMIYTKKEF